MARATQIRHTGIVVADLDRALWFYRDLLGLEIQRQMVESGPVLDKVIGLDKVEVETVKLGLPGQQTLVELLLFRSHPVSPVVEHRALNIGPTHVAFTVDDLRGLHASMSAQGIAFNCPPQASPDGKVLLTYCRDPDGSFVELVEIL